MKLAILHAHELDDFARLRADIRRDVELWLEAITELKHASRGNTAHVMGSICARMNCTTGTVYRKLQAFGEHGWAGLINAAKCPGLRGQPQAFKEYVSALYLHHQRDTSGREVHRVVCSQWAAWKRTGDARHAIPGYDTPPPAGPKGYPPGFSAKNLSRFCPDQHALRLIRQGTKAASNFLPSILKTRVGTSFGQIVFWDDQDYDNKVVAPGTSMKAMRPQGFNCIDYFSGCFLDYCIRMRYLDADSDTLKSLTQKDFVWFVVTYLQRHGFRNDDDGTIFVMEHGTASGFNNSKLTTASGLHNFDEALAFATGGKVTVERSGLFNQPAFAGMLFRPQSSGNFRFKSPLEGMFNLVRNYASGIVGQIGLNARSHGPEENYGLEKYTEQLLKIHATLSPEKQELIRYPLLQLGQFGQIMDAVYASINCRTDHELEGWARLGHTVPLIRLAPNDDAPWMTQADLSKLPPRTQELAISLLEEPGYTMPAKLSPQQVAHAHRNELTKLSDSAVPLLIPLEWAKVVRVKSNRTIVIQDKLCGDEPFTYTARIVTRYGAEMLRPDLEVLAYFNPISPEKLCLCDMNGSYIGTLTATTRIAFTDHETMLERLGERSAIKADLEAPVRAAMASTMSDRMDMKVHNEKLISSAPITEEEIAAARSESANQAVSTRRHRSWAEHLDQDQVNDAIAPENDHPTPISHETIANYLED
jgi:hypothetical protein